MLLSKVAWTDNEIGFFWRVSVIGIPYVWPDERHPQPDIFSFFQAARTYNHRVRVVLREVLACTGAITLTGSPLKYRFNNAELFHHELEIGRKGIRVGGNFIQVVTHGKSSATCIGVRRRRFQCCKDLVQGAGRVGFGRAGKIGRLGRVQELLQSFVTRHIRTPAILISFEDRRTSDNP